MAKRRPESPGGAAPLASAPAWDYAPSPEVVDRTAMSARRELFVGGRWREPTGGKYAETLDPSTGAAIAPVAEADARDVDSAVRAARTAYERVWSRMPGSERAKYAFRLGRALQERARELALAESMNCGVPIKDARDLELPLAAAQFFYDAGWADKLEYAFQGRPWRPLGVVGVSLAVDWPLLAAARKLAPAIACGNTVVLEPTASAPLTGLLLARLVEECELPPGVVNVVTGAAVGDALAMHPSADGLVFAGPVERAQALLRATAGTAKKVTVEVGGSASNVIFADAALEQAVDAIVAGIQGQGQARSQGGRLFVEEGVLAPVLRRLKDRMATLRVGAPLDKNTDVGPLRSQAELARVTGLVDAAEQDGADRHTVACRLPAEGFWLAPTLLSGVAQSSRIASDASGGPVLVVSTFRSPDEALEKVNNAPRGLSVGVWTDKGARALWMAQRVRAGVVWANTQTRFDACAPAGGTRESRSGRDGGRHGLSPYVRLP
jgi:aldehyde dehydrogenase (NAD+)